MIAQVAAHTTTAIAQSSLLQHGAIKAVCPKAPPGAQAHADDLQGYVLWGVLIMFGLGVIIGIGAIAAGRVFSMPHASKGGLISLVVVFLSAIGYMVAPGIVSGITGTGCV